MAFGVYTFQPHLDLDPVLSQGEIFAWNGTARPSFAGRNFLGGDFTWANAEATNAATQQEGRLAPSNPTPQHPENLDLTVPLIAPI